MGVRWIAVLWTAAVPALAMGAAPAPAAAQGTNPLLKSDLVRLLSNRSLPMDEVAELVRRNCLAFEPSDRDRADLRELGAPAEVMEAIEECERRAPAAGEPPAREPAGDAFAVQVNPTRLVVPAGSEAQVAVSLRRGGRIQPATPILLRGQPGPPGGPGEELRAETDGEGVAVFRFRATAAGTYPMNVVVPGAPAFQGDRRVEVVIEPVEPAALDAQPDRLESDRIGLETEVRVRVRDRYGNPAANRTVRLEPREVEARIEPTSELTTDNQGLAVFSVRLDEVSGPGSIAVFAGGNMLGRIPVAAGAADAARTGFISGADQSGTAGSRLPRPLVFEVRDASGLPVPEQQVELQAENARVEPAAARTDSAGRVAVEVELGTRVGPATLVASAGDVREQAELRVLPGAVAELTISRAGGPVDRLTLEGTDPVELTVRAVDEHGNAVPGVEVAASIADPGLLRMEIQRGDPSAGGADGGGDAEAAGAAEVDRGGAATVRLYPRGSGSTALTLRAGQARQTLPVDLRVIGAGRWGVTARASFVGFDYLFAARPEVRGDPGFVFDAQGRYLVQRWIAVRAGFAIGSLGARRPPGTQDDSALEEISESVALRQVGVGVDILPVRLDDVTPVIAVSLGRVQIQTDELGRGLKHTGIYYAIGAGLDLVLSPNLTGELRAEIEEVNDPGVTIGDQDVGTLYRVGMGLRVGF